MENLKPAPNYWMSILTMKCPRCRCGSMFKNKHPFKKLSIAYMLDMPDNCEECGQLFELEQGFWFGTGYVSYALAVAFSVATFVAWLVLIGVSTDDNRVFWWLGFNGLMLVIIQPWMMRISRVIYLYFFVRYDADYKKSDPFKFDTRQ